MAFVDHVRRIQRHDPRRVRPLRVGDWHAGRVDQAFAEELRHFPDVFLVDPREVLLNPALDTPRARTEALDALVRELHAQGRAELVGHELYAVAPSFHAPAELLLERSMLPYFGCRAHGVHLNGLVRRADGLHVWIATRAESRRTYPGQLDNLVGGGLPAGLGVLDNLVKEAHEEAGLDEQLVRRAKPVGTVSYRMDLERGLRDDVLFVFDLELPEHVIPQNQDGEVAAFELWPVDELLHEVDTGSRFKFNCNLVLLDLFVREGLITPEHPDYVEISGGLRLRE